MSGRHLFASFETLIVALGALTSSACATQGGLQTLAFRPSQGCRSLGPVRGTGGGELEADSKRVLGDPRASYRVAELEASRQAEAQASQRGATHVFLDSPTYDRNQEGKIRGAAISGEAYSCSGQIVFDTRDRKSPVHTKPKAPPVLIERSAGLRVLDERYWQSWAGNAEQPGFGSFAAQIDLSRAGAFESCGSVEYPSLGCRGTLGDCRILADGKLEAVQSFSALGQCIEKSRVQFELAGSALRASWFAGDTSVATGLLALRKDTHPLLAAVQATLPILPPRTKPVLDEEVFETLPQFLPVVLPEGFVTDEPASTRLLSSNDFLVVRQYRRADGRVATLGIVLSRSPTTGAGATLAALSQLAEPYRVSGFPVLFRPAAAGGKRVVHVALTPRLQLEAEANGLTERELGDVVSGVSLGHLALVEKAGQSAVDALNRPEIYRDQQGEAVEVATGKSAFAERVVLAQAGPMQGAANDPNRALGKPNAIERGGYYTLGCRGKIQVAFDSSALVDHPGPDLHIFEVGRLVEAMAIRISEDGVTWVDAGQVKGQPASLDVSKVATPGAKYRFVEISDLGEECTNESAGADIDAVGLIHGQLQLSAAPRKRASTSNVPNAKAPMTADELRRVAEAVRLSEGVPLSIATTKQGFSLSEEGGAYTVTTAAVIRADVNDDGRSDTVFLNSRRERARSEHRLEIYTERGTGLGALAQAVIGYGDAAPSNLHVNGGRLDFEFAGNMFEYELRHGTLIRLKP